MSINLIVNNGHMSNNNKFSSLTVDLSRNEHHINHNANTVPTKYRYFLDKLVVPGKMFLSWDTVVSPFIAWYVIHTDFRSHQILISLRISALTSRSMCGLSTGASLNKDTPRQIIRIETRHKTAGAQGKHKICGFNTYPGLICEFSLRNELA